MSESSTADSVAQTGEKPGLLKRLYLWVIHWADTPYGTPALFCISFAESSFFPIPPDVLQIPLSISKPRRSFYYAAVSVAASVLGALLGWYIGYALWATVGDFVMAHFGWLGFTPENFEAVAEKYEQYGFMAIAVAAFTPLPYKVFTVSAGMFGIGLPVLVLASVVGRSARFFTVAACIYVFGPTVKSLIEKYLGLATVMFAVLLIGGFVVIKWLL